MGFTRSPRAARLLASVLSSARESPEARELAAYSLGELGDRTTVPVLRRALRGSRESVRSAIQIALAKLGAAAHEHNGKKA